MKKKTFTVALLSAVLLSALAGTLFVTVGAVTYPYWPDLEVTFPIKNRTYSTSTIPVAFTITSGDNCRGIDVTNVLYSLDGQPNESIGGATFQSVEQPIPNHEKYYHFTADPITNVPDGDHILIIRAQYDGTYITGDTRSAEQVSLPIYFSVSTSIAFPNVTVFSPQPLNASSDVMVRFMVDQPVESLRYSLDGGARVEVDSGGLVEYTFGSHALWRGNLTLTDLPAGNHSLTVYATGLAGVTGNSTVAFTVEAAEQEPQPFPTVPVATSIAVPTVIGIGAGLLIHYKKRKH